MNSQYDVIIIGDSKEGNKLLSSIASANINIKIAFISREFKMKTYPIYTNVEYIKDEVLLADYRNRLFGCYLKSGARIYSTHLIFAVGQKYEPFYINDKKVPNVFHTPVDIPKEAKDLPAIVVGSDNEAVGLAVEVAKKYKYVYLCSPTFEISCTEAMQKKLTKKQDNKLVVLPNTHIIKVNISENTLKSVELDNYSTITCSAIYVKTRVSPDTSCVTARAGLIKTNEDGYLETDNKLESTLVPKCYAIGSCAQKCTKKMMSELVEAILNDFGGTTNVNS